MKMKKKLCSLLALLCILSLTACGGNSKGSDAGPSTPSTPQDMPTMSADSAGWDTSMNEEGAFLPEPSPDAGYGGVPANAKII